MVSEKMAKLINDQINMEIHSAYIYFGMANYYDIEGLEGFANWFYVQAQEEMDHAMGFRRYMLDNDAAVVLSPIASAASTYESYKNPLEATLRHEEAVTASINGIYAVASEEKDYKSMQFLDWYTKEQVEEEKNANDLIRKYQLFGKDSQGLFLLNGELAARIYVQQIIV